MSPLNENAPAAGGGAGRGDRTGYAAHPTRDRCISQHQPAGLWHLASWVGSIWRLVRECLCSRICDGYDRRAGRIVDGALAEIDRLREELDRITRGGVE